jgi:hypothetical protein
VTDQPLIPFEPAELRARHDGWTARKQIGFIEALAECGIGASKALPRATPHACAGHKKTA